MGLGGRQWLFRRNPNGSFGPSGSGAMVSILPGGPTSAQIAAGSLTTASGQTVTCTRASSKYCRTATPGALVLLGNNSPAVEPEGLLVEGQSTNVCIRSQEFSNAAWTRSGGTTVTPDNVTAPDGSITADSVAFAAGGDSIFSTPVAATAGKYTASVWIRTQSGTSSNVRVQLRGTSGSVIIASVTPSLTTTWQRVSVSGTCGAADPICVFVDSNSGAQNVVLWQGQLEANAVATSDIVTTAAAATRAFEVFTLTFPRAMRDYGLITATITPTFSGAGTFGSDFLLLNPAGQSILYQPGDNGVASFVGGQFIKPGPVFTSGTPIAYSLSWTNAAATLASSPGGATASSSYASSSTAGKTSLQMGTNGALTRDGFWIHSITVR